MSFFATAEHEKERLQYFASPEGRDDLYQYNQKERRTVLEVRPMNCTVHYFALSQFIFILMDQSLYLTEFGLFPYYFV
jgi:hypothetical protein